MQIRAFLSWYALKAINGNEGVSLSPYTDIRTCGLKPYIGMCLCAHI